MLYTWGVSTCSALVIRRKVQIRNIKKGIRKDWKEIETEKDIEDLLNTFGGFHNWSENLMISSRENLRKRGMIEQIDIDSIISLSYSELISLIDSKSSIERSASIHLLSNKVSCDNEDFVAVLLKRLSIEKSLYTKIEICNALEKGSEKTARQMVQYLGCIGNNQHRWLPDRISKKISYPLPRDIIARSLGKMNGSIIYNTNFKLSY